MCFGGGGGQPEQPMNKPAYAPEQSHTAVTTEVKPVPQQPATDTPSAAVPKASSGTGLDIGSM